MLDHQLHILGMINGQWREIGAKFLERREREF